MKVRVVRVANQMDPVRSPNSLMIDLRLFQSPARKRLEDKHSKYVAKSINIPSPHQQSSQPHLVNSSQWSLSEERSPASLTVRTFAMAERLHVPVPESCISFEEFCVRFIQRWWFLQRANNNSLYSMTSEERSMNSTGSLTRDKAATIIQRSWRRHIDIQVYHYYRDLIKFYSRGNPQFMLKCINPKEAALLDFAAGIHIRFRLAGEKFPPNIYYKIFTYRPVTDVNSFAPRDYTVSNWAAPGATVKNSKVDNPNDREDIVTDLSRWYQRRENNGWRLVSDRIFTSMETDSLLQESNSERKFFHFSRLRRQKDVDNKRKVKKRQWMANMYKQGKETERDLTESEIEEMVNWCDDLNFDNYVNNWLELATAVTLPNCEYAKMDDRQTENSAF
ncbi:protein MFI-like isoform X3 [Bolinopsis microptera]|uniref:protein MFI-like isoform X3 n=1 Tax=Bolinopsis microptera TaxID=2820187 RepID=UPI003079733C